MGDASRSHELVGSVAGDGWDALDSLCIGWRYLAHTSSKMFPAQRR